MTSTTRIAAAAALAVLGASASLITPGPASAATRIGDDEGQSTACMETLQGGYFEMGSTWYCTYSTTYGSDPAVLTQYCWGDYTTEAIDSSRLTFTCYS